MGFIDLHVHSSASDGTYTPTQVVELAAQAGLEAMALTDHDTVSGIGEALEAAKSHPVRVIPGIEVSSMFQEKEIHILGLFVNPEAPDFLEELKHFRQIREKRNEIMLGRLAADGMPLEQEALINGHPGTVITRAHVARAMLEAGYVSSIEQAFQKYLKLRGKYCPPKESPRPEMVVKALLRNHAFVALAHPCQYKMGDEQLYALISHMKELGMEGLEVYHSSHHQGDIQKLQVIAKKLELLPTGGSDFHGANKPDVSLGTGRGNLHISSLLLNDIEKKRQRL